VKIKYLLIFSGYKYITNSINMLRIKLEDLLFFLLLIRLQRRIMRMRGKTRES